MPLLFHQVSPEHNDFSDNLLINYIQSVHINKIWVSLEARLRAYITVFKKKKKETLQGVRPALSDRTFCDDENDLLYHPRVTLEHLRCG